MEDSGAECGASGLQSDPRLQELDRLWAELNEWQRHAILVLVRSFSGPGPR